MLFLREEHNTHSTPIDCAPGTVILAGTVKIMPALLINQMTGIFQWGIGTLLGWCCSQNTS